ncbi:MAG: hypothetical protein KFB96_25680 [Thiocapsa sp.]|uniref:hypothetical protein n=1 Tax=Thiocapsa sp. TaxID=2024551 RepID=UPI001BD143A7|nr:hypothetical protein [Thiocapsa sp.]QVL48883.1 MAG: hypothetical protein KFB96_25680 [Thiocapsa sp.]
MKDMKVMKGKQSISNQHHAVVQRHVAFGSLPIPHDTQAPRKNTPFMSFMPFMVKTTPIDGTACDGAEDSP